MAPAHAALLPWEAPSLRTHPPPGGVFYARERAFQDAVNALPSTGELESTRAQASVRLGQFDNFVHSAVVRALATCNASEARANLRVARQLLEELHRIANGKGHAGWDSTGTRRRSECGEWQSL